MPDYISDAAKMQWTRIVDAMPPGFYSPADEALLAAYCEAYADHVEATQTLKSIGRQFTVDGRVSPLVTIRNQAAKTMATLGSRLGLSPADRNGLKTPEKKAEGKWKGLIA